MNNGLKLLLLGSVGFIIWQGIKVKDFLEKVKATISDIKFINPTKIELELDVVNSSLQTFQFQGFSGNAIYNGSSISTITSNQQAALAPNTVTQISLQVNLNASQALSQLTSLLLGSGGLQPLRILGNMTINGTKIPIDQSKQITI